MIDLVEGVVVGRAEADEVERQRREDQQAEQERIQTPPGERPEWLCGCTGVNTASGSPTLRPPSRRRRPIPAPSFSTLRLRH